MSLGHSKGWLSAFESLGVDVTATDEMLTSTHWVLYVRIKVGDHLFDTVLTEELGSDDPRVPDAYRDMAKQALRRLMIWMNRED